MSTVFTKIINGEIPAYKVAEDENHLAFLDVNPLKKGHTLVIPKKEVDLIFDLEADAFKELWAFAQKVAHQISSSIPCVRVGIAVIGLEVPHAHIHLVPLDHVGDLNFSSERVVLTPEEFKEIQQEILEGSSI